MDNRALSPVIGTILLIALTATIGVSMLWLMDFGPTEPGPKVGTTESLDIETVNSDPVQVFSVKSIDGSSVDIDSLKVKIRGSSVTLDKSTIRDTPATADGVWSPGERLVFELSTNNLCLEEGEQLKYTIVHEPTKSTVATQKVTVKTKYNFFYTNNVIKPEESYKAKITPMGTSYQEVDTSNNIVKYHPITTKIRLGSDTISPWSGNMNEPDENLNSYTTAEASGGTRLSFITTSYTGKDYADTGGDITIDGESYDQYAPSSLGSKEIVVDGYDDSETNMVILRDGDKVPDHVTTDSTGSSLEKMLGPRLSDNGKVDVKDNEAIVLVELTEPNADPNDAGTSGDPDYNDAVFLVELQPSGGTEPKDSKKVSKNTIQVICG